MGPTSSNFIKYMDLFHHEIEQKEVETEGKFFSIPLTHLHGVDMYQGEAWRNVPAVRRDLTENQKRFKKKRENMMSLHEFMAHFSPTLTI